MRVIEKGTGDVFPMRVKCQRVTDEYGFAYGDKVDFCGSTLEVEESDIKKHKWFKYPDYSGTDYGVLCPVCRQFVVMPENRIPARVKEAAEEVFLH